MIRTRWFVRIVLCGVFVASASGFDRWIGLPSGSDGAARFLDAPVMSADEPIGPSAGDGGFVTGFAFSLTGSDPVQIGATEVILDRLVGLGVTSVALSFPVVQTGPTASEVQRDANRTPSDALLRLVVRAAHAQGLTVLLRPLLEQQPPAVGDNWRGTITLDSPERWFASYGDLVVAYARFAQVERVGSFSVGAEFESMEHYGVQWRSLIAQVRNVYDGAVTYSYSHRRQDLGFADALDFVGLDAFYPLDAPDAAGEDALVDHWAPWLEQISAIRAATGKPVVLTEVGARSVAGSYRQPWRHADGGTPDEADQATYFAALCRVAVPADPSLAATPLLAGLYVWGATADSLTVDPATDRSYSPFGKDAEQVISRCFASRTGS